MPSALRDRRGPEQALAAYERAEKVMAASRRIGQSKAISNPIGIRIRDLVMPPRRMRGSTTYHGDWEEKAA